MKAQARSGSTAGLRLELPLAVLALGTPFVGAGAPVSARISERVLVLSTTAASVARRGWRRTDAACGVHSVPLLCT
eukprot:5879082-Pleurochrysis_carterae.AAC.1